MTTMNHPIWLNKLANIVIFWIISLDDNNLALQLPQTLMLPDSGDMKNILGIIKVSRY